MFSGRPHGYGYVQNTHEKRARSDAHNYTIVGTVNTHLPPTINTRLPPNVTSHTTLMALQDTHYPIDSHWIQATGTNGEGHLRRHPGRGLHDIYILGVERDKSRV